MINNRDFFDEQHRLKEEFIDSFYQLIYVTLFLAFFSFLIPTFSLAFFILYILLIVACFYWKYASNRYKLYQSVKWRIGSLLGHIDVSAIFVGMVLWRVSDESLKVGLLQLLTLIIAIGIGHGFRKTIAQELRKPLTKWGKMLGAVGVIGAGKATLLAYFLAQFTTMNVLALLMYALILIVVIIIHSMWLYVEKPNWKPKENGLND
ncbi:hypothetical protein [Laceyella putida]|uniref:Uncharacterized protein n=1 Tax=Laceyella putida TaxID=110101 RepID=A0ABW2RQK2_9BACL